MFKCRMGGRGCMEPLEHEGDLWLGMPLPRGPGLTCLVKIPPIPAAKLDFVPTGLDSLFLRF